MISVKLLFLGNGQDLTIRRDAYASTKRMIATYSVSQQKCMFVPLKNGEEERAHNPCYT